MLKKMKRMYPHQSLMMIFILGLMTVAGSYIVEYIFKVRPCEMCYWQRYLAFTITLVAFSGTLFRGKIKKWFLGTISIVAATSLTIGVWQSLAQYDIVPLPSACQAPEEVKVTADAATESANLLANLKTDTTNYVDCSDKDNEKDFFVYKYTGVTLANLNVLLMTFITIFSFYKLFFKPRRRFRRYNNKRRYNNNNRNRHNNNNRRYHGSGYNRSNNRNNRNRHHNNNNTNRRNNNQNNNQG